MFKFAVFLFCLSVIEGRNIQRLIRDADLNATVPDLKNATASKANDPPEISDMQSDLVAPASGPKPLQAKYTIRVKPKLKDGVPQIQEIRIMPPKSASTKGFVKPLMVLKQNVTKAMIENIEIDVPEKGVKYTSKPSVEVIEGDHRELLKVSKGEAVVENGAQKSDTKSEDQENKPKEETTSQDSTQASTSQNSAEPSTSQNVSEPSTAQNAANSLVSQNTTESSTSSNVAKQSTSQDAPDKNSTISNQTPAASQNTASASQATSQPQAPVQAAQPAPASAQSPADAAPAAAAYNSVPETCTDDGRCIVYTDDRCRESWLMTNCRLKCKLCSK